MTNNKTKKLVGIAILASLAWIISMLSFPILPGTPFLKVDFSDLAVLFGMYVFGPGAGIAIAFIRSLLSYASTGGEMGFPIGDTAAFIATLSFTLPLYYLLIKRGTSHRNKLLSVGIASVSLTIVMSLVNWLFIAPAYMAVMGFSVGPMVTYIIYALLPFNMIKGVLVGTVFYIAFVKIRPMLDRTKNKGRQKKKTNLALNKSVDN
ncbi:ECF transporter S component [Alkalibacterium sp. MB6]|uniref:ECF transporter S component n=1 Tax=Alkalibacterium sp. MB6 TaxID=2081965 RepID=UPI00137B18B8|nr:ECF transporter S component [Alkalibacterium sp. MB6]